jgi:hypothetical protein
MLKAMTTGTKRHHIENTSDSDPATTSWTFYETIDELLLRFSTFHQMEKILIEVLQCKHQMTALDFSQLNAL